MAKIAAQVTPLLLPLCALGLWSGGARAEAPAKPKTKLILGEAMTAQQFEEAKHQLAALLALPGGFPEFGEDPTWPELSTYDLAAAPFEKLAKGQPLSGRDFPMSIELDPFKPGLVSLKIDVGALPNRDLAGIKVLGAKVTVGKKTSAVAAAKSRLSELGLEGLFRTVELELPAAPNPKEKLHVQVTLEVEIPSEVRELVFPWGGKPPPLAGFKWLPASKPNRIAYTFEKARFKDGLEAFGLGQGGRRLEVIGVATQEVGQAELAKKIFVDSTFDQLPDEVDSPDFAERHIEKTFTAAPSQLEVAVAGPRQRRQLVVEGSSELKPLFHATDLPSGRACTAKELGELGTFAHRSVAMADFGGPQLSLLLPDCLNFASAEFKVEGAQFSDKAGHPLPADAITVSQSGYQAGKHAYTFYFEGDAAAKLGKASGTAVVEVDELAPLAFDHQVVRRDPASGHWTFKAQVPDGTDLGPMVFLDRGGRAFEKPSSQTSSGGSEVVLDTEADLAGVDKVLLFKQGEKRTVRVPFRVDFATIPAPQPKKRPSP